MEALIASTVAVAIAEIGDKTQLLSLFLIARYRAFWPLLAGIVAATLLNHAASAWFGTWLAESVPGDWLRYGVAASFILIGLWVLIPDREEEPSARWLHLGPFGASLILFFLAEIGDKTQIATVVLAARFDATLAVIAGTTLGMVAANLPVLLAGDWLLRKVPMAWVRGGACALFLAFGIVALWTL